MEIQVLTIFLILCLLASRLHFETKRRRRVGIQENQGRIEHVQVTEIFGLVLWYKSQFYEQG